MVPVQVEVLCALFIIFSYLYHPHDEYSLLGPFIAKLSFFSMLLETLWGC